MRLRWAAPGRRAWRGVIVALALVATCWIASGCAPRESRVPPLAGPEAPAWEADDLAGIRHSLAGLRGKVVLIDFWATWCAPCRQEIPEYIAWQTRYASEGLVIIGMSLDTLPAEAVRDFAQKAGINYPIVLADADMAEAYAVEMLPTTVLIDREGRIRHRKVGAMKDPEAYAANVRALLAERAR